MDAHRLVMMANQISDFFASSPSRDEAVESVAQHLKNFWEPRMRHEIIAHVKRAGGEDLKEIARDAVLLLERREAAR
jgi:formate dehydrogenase subunit delta